MNATSPHKPEPDPIPPQGEIVEDDEPVVDLSPFVVPHVVPPPAGLGDPLNLDDDEAEVVPVKDRDDGLGGTAVRVGYTNEEGQEFAITTIAANENLARQELVAHRVSLRAVRIGVGGSPKYVSDPDPWIADRVAEKTVAVLNAELALRASSQITMDDLIALRDRSRDDHMPTLEELVDAYPVDSRQVLSVVATDAIQRYSTYDAQLVQDAVHALWMDPGVPFIDDVYNAPTDAEADDRLRAELQSDDSGTSVIEVTLTNPSVDGRPVASDRCFEILFAFDPTVHEKPRNPYVRHYKAKRQTSARARIRRKAGRMTLFMWRKAPNYRKLGSRTASLNRKHPPVIADYSGAAYDIRVRGRRNNSNYDVAGSWELGAGWSG